MSSNKAQHANSLANLTQNSNPAIAKANQFQPGRSPNPTGRATRMFTLVTMALREKLAEVDVETKMTFAARIAGILVKCITHPDPEVDKTRIMAIDQVIDRCEGKPKQQIDVNDVTAELRSRTDEELMFHLEHGHFPEESVQVQ